MAEIKSTLEKVLERAASMGNASQEEIQADERIKEGMRMAADYLQGKTVDFSGVQEATDDSRLALKGVVQVFLRNITLPRDGDQQRTERAMQGILELAGNSGELTSVFREVKGILNHYIQNEKKVRQQVEDHFRQQIEQALAQQTGQQGADMKVDPVMHPKFQEEWTKVKANVDDQYNQVLDQHKEAVAQRFGVTM